MKTFTKKLLAVLMSAAMVLTMFGTTTFAALNGDIDTDQEHSAYSYDAPTTAMSSTNDIYVTASAHRAASPVLGILGLNATSGFGMINGTTPSSLSEAVVCPAMGVWGSSLNDNPDSNYWNLFYNYYATENSLNTVDTTDVDGGVALLNGGWSGSPMAADTTLFAQYGNISGSMVSRPDILVGVTGGTTEEGGTSYASQIATINSFDKSSEYYRDGDETYDPELVAYNTTYIKQMIDSVYAIAEAADAVETSTGKTTRYGDVQTIAQDYESYVYGIISYVKSQLAAEGKEEKVVAVVNGVTERTATDGSKYYEFSICNDLSMSATSLVRAVEYSTPVCKSLFDVVTPRAEEETSVDQRSGKETTSTVYYVTADDILDNADVIVTINNNNLSKATLDAALGETFDGPEITQTPAALYGVTMNSVENAVGYAYVIANAYPEYFNAVDLCAYFYQHFLHISNVENVAKVVQTNFASLEGAPTLNTETYSASAIEEKIRTGAAYYVAHPEDFTDAIYDAKHIGLVTWNPDTTTVGSILCTEKHDCAEYAETIKGTAATCCTTGTTSFTKCSVCGKILTAAQVIPVDTTAHNYLNSEGVCTHVCTNTNCSQEEPSITLIDAEGKEQKVYECQIKAATAIKISDDAPWHYNTTSTITGTVYSVKEILDTAGIEYDSAHGLKFVASDGFVTGIAAADIEKLYIADQSELFHNGEACGAAGTFGLAMDGVAGNKQASDVVSCSVADTHVLFVKSGKCRHYCAICNEAEPSITLTAADGTEQTIYECQIKAATAVTLTDENAWHYNSTNTITGTVYSVKEILDNAGIQYDSAHGLKFVASDGFVTGVAAADIEKLYIADQSELYHNGTVQGAAGTFGLAVDGAAGNKQASDVVSCSVASDHVWFVKGGACRHYCSICNEKETATAVDAATHKYTSCETVEEHSFTDGVCTVCGQAEAYITLTDASGAEKKIYESQIKAATAVTLTDENAWHYNDTNTITGTVYSVKEILDNAGIQYDSAHGLKFVASDGFVTGVAAADIEKLYIADQSELYHNGTVQGAAGTFGLAMDGVAGNKQASDVVSCSVASDHVWFVKGGACRHYCSICGEKETATAVDETSHKYTSCGTVEDHSFDESGVCTVCGAKKASEDVFSDIADCSDGVKKAIVWASDNEIVKGYADGTFKPTADCKRSEMAVMLYRLAGRPEVTDEMIAAAKAKFSDISSVSSGALKAIAWAVSAGVINGYSDGTFKPEDSISRESTVVMLWRMAGKPEATATSTFTDTASCSAGVMKAINWAASIGITKGTANGDGTYSFAPKGNCQRQHIATFVYRYDQKVNK